MTKEALKLALEALEEAWYHVGTFQPTEKAIDLYDEARTAIKKALAQPEPVAMQWLAEMIMSDCGCSTNNERLLERVMARIGQYERANTPPQRPWVGLTQTQVKLLWEGVQEEAIKSGDSLNWVFYMHINEALKEKNT